MESELTWARRKGNSTEYTGEKKKVLLAGSWWLTPVILVT
jgi:hypothetical protein